MTREELIVIQNDVIREMEKIQSTLAKEIRLSREHGVHTNKGEVSQDEVNSIISDIFEPLSLAREMIGKFVGRIGTLEDFEFYSEDHLEVLVDQCLTAYRVERLAKEFSSQH